MLKKIAKLIETNQVGPFLHAPLYGLSLVYGALVRLRLALYSKGALKIHALPVKVVCVGNLSTGGTGKTPVVMAIAKRLVEEGLKPAILSRGYAGTGAGVTVVSDGDRPLVNATEAGDEPYLMATSLSTRALGMGVPVVVGADRVAAGRLAIREFAPDVILLDDGFQHLRLKRDLDIALFDPSRGEANDFLLPRGLLREPKSGLRRARWILVKCESIPPELERYASASARLGRFHYRPTRLVDVRTGARSAVKSLSGKSVFVFAGIAAPNAFVSTVEATGAKIAGSEFFGDHHAYREEDIKAVVAAAKAAGAKMLLTTEKDAVKLSRANARMDVCALGVEVTIEDMDRLVADIKAVVAGKGS
jgi:tetraacyldisaccharide 4'-kinase